MSESIHASSNPGEVALYPDDWDRADLAALAGECGYRHPHVAIIDADMAAAWLASGAAATYSDRHLRVMIAWLRGTRADRPLRPHEVAMLAGYVAELDRRGLTTEAA